MKLGGFGLMQHYHAIAQAGYDYAELDLPELENLEESAFVKFKDEVTATGLPVLTGARLLPVTDPIFMRAGFEPMDFAPYLKHACARAASLGIGKIIMGNGKARSLGQPDDLQNEGTFVRFLQLICDIAADNGLEFILEPLGPKYSNYLNTLPQAAAVLEKVKRPNAFLMADLRHMLWSEEDLADLSAYRALIHHVHVDYPRSFPARGYPRPSDDYDYGDFIAALKASGYDDTLTIEADFPDDWHQAHDLAMQVLAPLF